MSVLSLFLTHDLGQVGILIWEMSDNNGACLPLASAMQGSNEIIGGNTAKGGGEGQALKSESFLEATPTALLVDGDQWALCSSNFNNSMERLLSFYGAGGVETPPAHTSKGLQENMSS